MNHSLRVAIEAVKAAAFEKLSVPLNVDEIHEKGHQDLVTIRDVEMERSIKHFLLSAFQNDKFIGEEENQNLLTEERTWICDPIDGTINYANGHPFYGVQLALLVHKKPVLTVVYLPSLNELYHAQVGEGAYWNGEKVKRTEDKKLSNAILTFGDFSKSNPSSRQYQLQAMEALMPYALKMRIQGASSVDFAFLVSGKNHAHILFSKRLWELAPGLLLAEEAGYVTGLIPGEAYGFEGQGLIIAQNKYLLSEIYTKLGTIPERRYHDEKGNK